MSIVKRRELNATYYDSYGTVDNDGGSLQLVANPGTDSYIVVDEGSVSITKPAYGSDGEVQIKDTLGNVIRKFNADETKDFPIGKFMVGPNVGLEAIIANAGNQQAKASISLSAHITLR